MPFLKTQCAPRQRNPHQSAHQRNEKKKIGMIWITYMIPHATKSGKRHRKFFCWTIDEQGSMHPLYPGPHFHCPARAHACPGSAICTGNSKCAFAEAIPLPCSEGELWMGSEFNLRNPISLLVSELGDNIQIHAAEKSLGRLPSFCYTINRNY